MNAGPSLAAEDLLSQQQRKHYMRAIENKRNYFGDFAELHQFSNLPRQWWLEQARQLGLVRSEVEEISRLGATEESRINANYLLVEIDVRGVA